MEITYFALGMLSMVALMVIGVIVWGVFKVMKIESQIADIKESHRFDVDNIQRQFDNVYRRSEDDRNIIWREYGDYRKEIDSKFEKLEQYAITRNEELSRMVNDMYNDACRYTDRRFDKAKPQKEVL
jgi:hypothetical protein